jgi:DNA-binding response OmpR family regulator
MVRVDAQRTKTPAHEMTATVRSGRRLSIEPIPNLRNDGNIGSSPHQMDSRAARTFAINGVIVDVAGGLVRDGEGSEIALRPQAFDLLIYLLENAGRLVKTS